MRTNGVVKTKSSGPWQGPELNTNILNYEHNNTLVLPQSQASLDKPSHKRIAEDFGREYDGKLIYTHSTWYYYQDGMWHPLHKRESSRIIWDFVGQYEYLGVKPTKYLVTSVAEHMANVLYVPDSAMDSTPHLVNLKNGVFDQITGEFLPHSPNYYFTSQLPFDYDPDAKTAVWDEYLRTTFTMPDGETPDPELAAFVEQAIGYSLTLDNRFQVWFWAKGGGANGKGILFKLLEALAGDGAIPLDINNLKKDQYQLANLVGKRIAFCTEANASDNLVQDGILKALSGGDTIQVRQIRQEPFALHPVVKMWWSMNNLPAVADTTEGFWRRMRLIPFNTNFSKNGKMDRNMMSKLMAELPGIFNRVMAAYRKLVADGEFTESEQVRASTEEYKEESNTLWQFIQEECEIDPQLSYQSSEVYARYTEWCQRNHLGAYGVRRFKAEMESLGYSNKSNGKFRVYQGVGPRSNTTWGLS